jgi:hypothetical protein
LSAKAGAFFPGSISGMRDIIADVMRYSPPPRSGYGGQADTRYYSPA